MARQLAAPGDDDCALKDSACPDCKASSCADFYEYNAKVQLTSWAGGCTCPMRFLLFGQNRSIFIGNLGLCLPINRKRIVCSAPCPCCQRETLYYGLVVESQPKTRFEVSVMHGVAR